ncbi:MAG: hypothetical protein A2X49_14740 [Lentisphaerae bacterium GWF2_52_8]|nr:MAG: hypothetical protein A2X49_14740 [Lentisphaerae bacterium GWF2_52_8]
MDWLHEQLQAFFELFRRHLGDICIAFIATVLTVFGNDINNLVKKQIKQQNFILRLAVFVGLCAFAYGAMTVIGGKLLAKLIAPLSGQVLVPVIIGLFLLLGVIAEEKDQF